jgi:hypothetical protein
MAALVVNIVLILAVLVLAATWLIGAARRRRHGRRQHAEERKLILQAFLGAATPPTPDPAQPAEPAAALAPSAAQPTAASPRLDAASVAALLDLLEERRAPRRGVFAGMVNGPRGVWAAGARAGQQVGRRTMERHGTPAGDNATTGPKLYRAAAAELVDIHAHDPHDAQREYRRYAAALADPAVAELYVRSAAYATYADHEQVRQVVEQITSVSQTPGTVG